MVKFLKSLFFMTAGAIMAACIACIPESAGAVSVSYVTVLGIYLGMDVAGMITKTAAMPKDEYSELKVYKYVLSAVSLITLIALCIWKKNDADMSAPLTSFVTSSMIILGCLIGGLEGNRMATGIDGGGR